MRTHARVAVVASAVALAGCFSDVPPGDTAAGDTTGDAGDGDGDGDGDGAPGDGDGAPGDGDGAPGDGDGAPGDGDGAPGCQPGDCGDNEYCINGVCEAAPEGMVAIEAGPFWMGCNEELDDSCNPDEYPYHEVTLSSYAIDRTEVTADAYDECVSQGECTAPLTDLGNNSFCNLTSGLEPVHCVTWFQARDYCEWQSKQLPTEAQWEKAARGNDGRLYPWGNQAPSCNLAVIGSCDSTLEPVGSRPAGASPYGVLDMVGNVMEWTADWYLTAYYLESPDQDPLGPANGMYRVIRSSMGIFNNASDMRVSMRYPEWANSIAPDAASPLVGFRCAYNP